MAADHWDRYTLFFNVLGISTVKLDAIISKSVLVAFLETSENCQSRICIKIAHVGGRSPILDKRYIDNFEAFTTLKRTMPLTQKGRTAAQWTFDSSLKGKNACRSQQRIYFTYPCRVVDKIGKRRALPFADLVVARDDACRLKFIHKTCHAYT